jgi:hypothetical protein
MNPACRLREKQATRWLAWIAILSVFLVGIRVHALYVGSSGKAVVYAAADHPERHNLRSFAVSYFHPIRPFTIALLFSEAAPVASPPDAFVVTHRGGFYVNRPPPRS